VSLTAGCPRCATPVASTGDGDTWSCPEHGVVQPLWRPEQAAYAAFVDHLALADGFPTYLPWPLGPGWEVSDFAVVRSGAAVATLTLVSGTTDLDGPVEVMVVAEEAGVGLGARCAGTVGADPGPEVGDGPPMTKVKVGNQQVSLWPVSLWGAGEHADSAADPVTDPVPDRVTDPVNGPASESAASTGGPDDGGPDDGGPWSRSAVVGEAAGRWLWLVFRPASAILMLRDEWILRDVSDLGPSLVELPFGGGSGSW